MTIVTILEYLTLLAGFYMAWNIGANDVANAMGTSVGSRALTLKKAVILAAILEFAGSVLVGGHVSETIQKGIVNPEIFQSTPMIFIIGMLGALIATGIWLNLASYLALPVSTTHAIVGAVLGFGMIIGGMDAVHWDEMGQIVLSWILSPLMSGIISYLLFNILQKKIFFALNPMQATRKLAPYLVFACITILTLSVLFQGLANLHLILSFPKALLFSLVIGLIAALLANFLLSRIPITAYEISAYSPHYEISLEKAIKHLQRIELSSSEEMHKEVSEIVQRVQMLSNRVKSHSEQQEHRNSPFSSVEKVFVYLQIMSACLVAFAHGANDVANAIGPVAGVLQVLQTQMVSQQSSIPFWLLIMGGAGIVLGLATWGWRVIETIGKKITELTPTRGFCAEFGAAATILLASKLGMPISTTHALVGAVLGVGLARGLQALNLKILREIVLSWIITIPICAILSILVFYALKAIFI